MGNIPPPFWKAESVTPELEPDDMNQLETSDRTNLVGAINDVVQHVKAHQQHVFTSLGNLGAGNRPISLPTPYTFDPSRLLQGSTPADINLSGGATASITSTGMLSVVSAFPTSANRCALVGKQFHEGVLEFVVISGYWMVRYHGTPDGAGYRVWSGDDGNIYAGLIDSAGAVNALATAACPVATGSPMVVRVRTGPDNTGRTFLIDAWAQGTAPPAFGATPLLTVDNPTFGATSSNEGVLLLETYSTNPALFGPITIYDAEPEGKTAGCAFSGRWFGRFEGNTLAMATCRQGDSFRFRVTGTTAVVGAFVNTSDVTGSDYDPYLYAYVDQKLVGAPVIINGTPGVVTNVELISGLDPTIVTEVDMRLGGLNCYASKWQNGYGLLLADLFAIGGQIAPWPDERPVALWIGDSITEGLIARGEPTTQSSTGGGDACYARLTSEALGYCAHINGFGGTGLTVVGTGGEPVTLTNYSYFMYDRWIDQHEEGAEIVIINIGTNDAGDNVSAETFIAAYEALIADIQQNVRPKRIYTMRPFNGSYASNIQTMAEGWAGVTYIDTTGWCTEFTDGLHPTLAGHQQIATAFETYLIDNLISPPLVTTY